MSSPTLFSLIPMNDNAAKVVYDPDNRHLVSKFKGADVINIGFHIRSRSCHAIATLGRSIDADVVVRGAGISKTQCSFEIEPTTKVVMLFDHSHGQTTQVSGEKATPFEHGRIRQVVIQEQLNTILSMGIRESLVKFELSWHQNPEETMEKVKTQETMTRHQTQNPRLARTLDEADTVLPSHRQTRIHTSGPTKPKIRYATVRPLGRGQFGAVWKAINADTGKLFAVKILENRGGLSEAEWGQLVYGTFKREVEALDGITHVCTSSEL